MDQLHLLLLLCFSMLVGSFFSGYVPMAFKLSDSKSRLLALMGSGILVGTALAIIIPEGIDSLYASPDSQIHNILTKSNSSQDAIEPPPNQHVNTWTIGLSLVVGFVLMLLIDQFSIYQSGTETVHSHHSDSRQTHEYTLANQDDDDDNAKVDEFKISNETKPIRTPDSHRVSMRNLDNGTHPDTEARSTNHRAPVNRSTPTLGLVIHASADGVALGAAATTSHRDVEMIIFLAIMLHKAPAAFSLVVFLIHRGLKHSTIRRHLLAFSLSAPLAAMATYFGLSQSGKEALRNNNATGIAMLFSAGTFLYVATVHVLPELVHNKLLSPKELIFLVGGTFLPLLLTQTI